MSSFPKDVKPGVVTGSDLMKVLNHAKANGYGRARGMRVGNRQSTMGACKSVEYGGMRVLQ